MGKYQKENNKPKRNKNEIWMEKIDTDLNDEL